MTSVAQNFRIHCVLCVAQVAVVRCARTPFSHRKISTVMRRQIKCNATTQTEYTAHIEYNEMCNGSGASVAIITYGAEPMYTTAMCNNNNGTYMCARICTTLNFIVYLLRCFPSSIIIKFLAHIHRTHLPHTQRSLAAVYSKMKL